MNNRYLSDEDFKKLRNLPIEELHALMHKALGLKTRTLEGVEKEHMLTVFKLIDPISESNNQHAITEVFEYAGKTYNVNYYLPDEIEIEEVIHDSPEV